MKRKKNGLILGQSIFFFKKKKPVTGPGTTGTGR
jgi:hypothetical protein